MPRILSGKRRGAILVAPGGKTLRPTLARIREALFSMLTSQLGSFDGLEVLDPYAGTGALGLEAWSRGAACVDFVEANREHFGLLMQNVAKLRANEACRCLLGRSPEAWKRLERRRYDLVLCDPPYGDQGTGELLERLRDEGRLKPAALVSIENDGDTEFSLPDGFLEIKRRQYKHILIVLLQYKGQASEI